MAVAPTAAVDVETVARRVIDEVRGRTVRFTATYRLQLRREFTFRDAAAVVAYLHDLGVSHVYCSPYLRARTGSPHGYDLCAHGELNPELGGEEGFAEFIAALKAHGMGQVLDIVPNHMAASPENPWWFDVLENGPASPYSSFFDIDWEPVKHELKDKVLLPILGRQYGEVLEEGQLRLEYLEGAFLIRYYDHALPVGPKTAIPILTHRLDELRTALGESHTDLTELESIVTALEHLPPQASRRPNAVRERHREKEVIKRRLRDLCASSESVREHVSRNVADYNGDPARPESFDLLDRLLAGQAYRLCQWRAAADEINYRRFFDVNELAAICMELPEVFHRSHTLLRKLAAEGIVDGFRVDHVDGLYDPEQYLWRLQWAYLADIGGRHFAEVTPSAADGAATTEAPAWRDVAPAVLRRCCGELGLRMPTPDDLRAVLHPDSGWEPPPPDEPPPGDPQPAASTKRGAAPLFVLVEKILSSNEPLPEHWPTAGTTGYDFLNLLDGLFIAPHGYADIIRKYTRAFGRPRDLRRIEHDAKSLILRIAMSSELQMLAHRVNRVSEQHRRTRDLTLNSLRVALREVLACFPVYRVYPGKEGVSDRDRRFVDDAFVRARRNNRAVDPAVFEFLHNVLLLHHPHGLSAEQIVEREVFTGKFQQVTSPVMAKGVEDTAFYIYVPLASVCEVGGDPSRPVTAVAEFHAANRRRNREHPRAMLSTSTHDTKRSEDVRARLNVLSELSGEWHKSVTRFARLNKRLVRDVEGEPAPSRNDEYLFYQSLLGVWPMHPPEAAERAAIIERLQAYMEKATHEAKTHTSWLNPNQAYDTAVRNFVEQALRDKPNNKFVREFQTLHARIAVAGQFNALFQTALKLLSPGVPDVYQGQELWDYSLVDPDNRRPVDYDLCRKSLAEVRSWDALGDDDYRSRTAELCRTPSDSRLKMLVTSKLLELRRRRTDLFTAGEYVPLETTGKASPHLVAFGWRAKAEAPLEVIAVVPRLVLNLISTGADRAAAPYTAAAWHGSEVVLPAGTVPDATSLFTRRPHTAVDGKLCVETLLAEFPAAVLQTIP